MWGFIIYEMVSNFAIIYKVVSFIYVVNLGWVSSY